VRKAKPRSLFSLRGFLRTIARRRMRDERSQQLVGSLTDPLDGTLERGLVCF